MIFLIVAGAKVFFYTITLYLMPQTISVFLTANITDPNLFIIQAVGKARLDEVVKGAWPFAAIMLATAVLMWFWQDLALYIPYML